MASRSKVKRELLRLELLVQIYLCFMYGRPYGLRSYRKEDLWQQWHNGTQERVVLIVDVIHPELWVPPNMALKQSRQGKLAGRKGKGKWKGRSKKGGLGRTEL